MRGRNHKQRGEWGGGRTPSEFKIEEGRHSVRMRAGFFEEGDE